MVEVSETIQCPYCGQSFEIVIDTSTGFQRFTTDCEVCCRPWRVDVTRDSEYRYVDISRGDGVS